jgi:outer membrane protein assembly factor BamB
VVHDGKIVIVRDHQRQSTIEVLNAKTGKTYWKLDREESNSWATPIVLEHSGRTQVITAASNRVRSYDLDDGTVIWECSGLTGNVTPCPVIEGDTVVCMSGYKGYAVMALPLSAKGDISGSAAILWKGNQGTPYVSSPVLYDGLLFFNQSNQAIWSCLDSRTGDTVLERTRLPSISNIYSSPVAAAGRMYVMGRSGTTLVLKRSRTLQLIATNKLDEPVSSSPALAGRELFIRGNKSVYCIAEDSKR